MNITDLKKLAKDSANTTAVLRAHMTIAGLDAKAQTALLAEAGIGRRTSGFTQTDTLALLEGGVSENELYNVLLNAGAKNELRWVSDRNRVRVTMNAIYKKLGQEVVEVPATEAQKSEAKELVKAK
jgi:hypothetical protein